MKQSWKTYKLGDVTFFKNGKARPSTEGVYPVYGGNGILGSSDEYNSNREVVVVGRVGAYCGSVFFENRPIWVSDNALYTLPKNNFDTKFIFYLLKNLQLNRYAEGSSHPLLTQTLLNQIEVFMTDDVDEQKQIASVLSSFDDKIELNLQMNQTLENIAHSIFREWFVNFNFPGFDGQLIDGLPKGWKKGSILEVANLLSGGTPKTEVKEYWDGDVRWISAKDITECNGGFIIETEKKITRDGLKNSAAKLLPRLTTIVSARGTVGNYCILSEEMSISQSNYGLKSKSRDNDFFIFQSVKNMVDIMRHYSYGTVFDTITTKTFKEIEVILPNEEVASDFNEIVKPFFDKILSNTIGSQVLKNLRDSLLPKLMSGKFDIKE